MVNISSIGKTSRVRHNVVCIVEICGGIILYTERELKTAENELVSKSLVIPHFDIFLSVQGLLNKFAYMLVNI